MARTISIVGAGRVGRTLGKRLRELGWRVGAVVTRSAPTARAAMRAIGAGSAQTHLDRDTLAADVILLATPDASLAAVAKALAEVGGRECRGKVVLHTSGALDRSVLAPLARRGAATGSLHPMQTFSGRGVPQLRNVIFAVEGDPEARRVARGIARSLGGVPVIIEGRSKAAYHAAGALAAGHALALFEAATQILTKIGFPRRRAMQTLLPLIRQMLDNFERLGPQAAWTGPIARGDYATIAKHRKALRGYPRECQQAYAALSLLVGRVLSKAPPATLARLRRVLAER
jgi:predicted short-subunit dehydrogenase-like oxidoreductase (DUF2520 family)